MSSPPRVLIVDDDRKYSAEIASACVSLGLEPVLATTPAEALEELGQRPVDVVLLDLVLGEGSGFQVLDHLRSQHRNIPVLIVTANIRAYVQEVAAFFDQVDLVVGKPYPARELAAHAAAFAGCGDFFAASEPVAAGPVHEPAVTQPHQEQQAGLRSR